MAQNLESKGYAGFSLYQGATLLQDFEPQPFVNQKRYLAARALSKGPPRVAPLCLVATYGVGVQVGPDHFPGTTSRRLC